LNNLRASWEFRVINTNVTCNVIMQQHIAKLPLRIHR